MEATGLVLVCLPCWYCLQCRVTVPVSRNTKLVRNSLG